MVGASREAKHSKCHHPRDLSPPDVRVIPNRSRGGGCHSPGACHGKRLRSEGACPWRLPAWDGAPTAEFGQTRACRGRVCLGGGVSRLLRAQGRSSVHLHPTDVAARTGHLWVGIPSPGTCLPRQLQEVRVGTSQAGNGLGEESQRRPKTSGQSGWVKPCAA